MFQKMQLKVATKRSNSSCFKTKCSTVRCNSSKKNVIWPPLWALPDVLMDCCMQALPETLEIVQSTIAKQLSIEESSVTPQTKFADLGADSLDTVRVHI